MRCMNNRELLQMWNQQDLCMRRIVVSEVLNGLPDSLDVLLRLLDASSDDRMAELVIPICARLPFLKKGFDTASYSLYDSEGNLGASSDFVTYSDLHSLYSRMLESLRKSCNEGLVKKCYRYFDGLRHDLELCYPAMDFRDSLRREELSAVSGHQLMVFVTGICNMHCPYCFSSDIERQHISEADIERIFRWAAKNGCDCVTPCGGEPLIYPHIGRFFDLVADYGMKTYFASNCSVSLRKFSQRQIDAIQQITFHITETLWQNDGMMRIFCDNILFAQEKNISIIARANIYKPDLNIAPWFDLIDKYGLKKLNIALTIPSGSHDNVFIDQRLFSDYVPVVLRCVDECRKRKVSLSFAKPMPPCVFGDEMSLELLKYDNFFPMCNVCEDDCMRNVCLSPDMKFTPCLGVDTPKIPFDESLTWDDIAELIRPEVEGALHRRLFEKCDKCFLYARNLCQGACLSYKYL